MKATLLKYIKEHPSATFAEFDRDIPGFSGDVAMQWGEFHNLILWPSLSEEAFVALTELIDEKVVVMKATSIFNYFVDGTTLRLPLAGGIKHYKKERWVPVAFSVGRKKSRVA